VRRIPPLPRCIPGFIRWTEQTGSWIQNPPQFDARCLAGDVGWRARFDELHDDHAFSVLVQQVASLAETFVGTLFSSFTSQIQRSRGAFGDPRCLYCYNDWSYHPRIAFERCEFMATRSGPYSWNRIQFPVDPRAYSWLRVWPEAFRDVQVD
jgi:hypothetical protein